MPSAIVCTCYGGRRCVEADRLHAEAQAAYRAAVAGLGSWDDHDRAFAAYTAHRAGSNGRQGARKG